MNAVGDMQQWHEVFLRAYRLKFREIRNQKFQVCLYSPLSFLGRDTWSTAPYLTDGGIQFQPNANWDDIQYELSDLGERQKSRFLLLKSRNQILGTMPAKVSEVPIFRTYLANLTPGTEKLFASIKGSRRTEVRKAQTAKAEIVFGHLDLLEELFMIVSQRWAELGTPTHGKNFFRSILEVFGDRARVAVGRVNGRSLSAALLLNDGVNLFHPFAATLSEGNKVALNSLLYWEIMKFGCEQGLQFFDMGRSRLNQSTVPFKRSWGALEIPLHYYYYLNSPKSIPDYDSNANRALNLAWSKLPLGVTRALGPHLIQGVL